MAAAFSFKASTSIFIDQKQTPAEQRLGLNLMINVLCQSTNSSGEKLLHETVYHLAEFLVMTGGHIVPSKGMVAQLLTKYDKADISSQDLRRMISILSDNVFDDSTESRAQSRFLVESESDSDQDEQPAKQVQVKSNSVSSVSKFLDQVLQTTTVDEDEDASNELFYTKLLELFRLGKFDRSHIVALVKYHATPRECIEDQGRAVNNIMKCIDASLKSLIVFPHSDTIKSQNNIQKVQGSFALACLMRNIYGQDHTAIPKQLQQLQDRAKQYATTVDMPKFKREFQTERAIYNKMVQLFGRRQDIERKKSEIEICEILLSEVYLQDKELAVLM